MLWFGWLVLLWTRTPIAFYSSDSCCVSAELFSDTVFIWSQLIQCPSRFFIFFVQFTHSLQITWLSFEKKTYKHLGTPLQPNAINNFTNQITFTHGNQLCLHHNLCTSSIIFNLQLYFESQLLFRTKARKPHFNGDLGGITSSQS